MDGYSYNWVDHVLRIDLRRRPKKLLSYIPQRGLGGMRGDNDNKTSVKRDNIIASPPQHHSNLLVAEPVELSNLFENWITKSFDEVGQQANERWWS